MASSHDEKGSREVEELNNKESNPSLTQHVGDQNLQAAVNDAVRPGTECKDQNGEQLAAVAGPSNSNLGLGEAGTPGEEPKTRKRERCEDDDESECEERKRHEDEGTLMTAGGNDVAEDVGERQEHHQASAPFPRPRVRTHQRRYRRRLHSSSSSSSSSSDNAVNTSSSASSHHSSSDERHANETDSSDDSLIANRILDALHHQVRARDLGLDSDDTWSLLDSDDSDSDAGEEEGTKEGTNDDKKFPKCLSKEVPKHKWSITKNVINRQLGMRTRQQEPELFWKRCYGSLHCVKRLELMYKLDEHLGCVNAISFNQTGSRLASGSDDKKIIIWDWPIGKSLLQYSSGHTSNVFQAKFLPMSGDNHIVSSARDGQVRLASLSSSGECRSTRRLAYHNKAVNKLSLLPETPHMFLSAGEDAKVKSIDVRGNKPSTILTVKKGMRRIGLYSVDTNPLNSNEFCVCGVDYYIRLYDKRKIDLNGTPMKKFCPSHIEGTSKYTNVTCALYNHDGTEIIGSYNDENLYLFDTRHSDGADFVHKYEGHRNSATVKSCDFFGSGSEYIMSGSDCGHLFFWDKNTEAIVQFMRGDEKGVVNALVGHPQFPILATSGLDSDVKIWIPSCEQDPEMKDLRRVVAKNIRGRADDQPYPMGVFESHVNMNVDGSRMTSSDSDSDSDGYPHSLQCPTS